MTAPTRDVQENTPLGQEPSRGLGEPDVSRPMWTPEPWRVSERDDSKVVAGPCGIHIAQAATTGLGFRGPANAHLIAAALALYEALLKARENVVLGIRCQGINNDPAIYPIVELIDAALALARGVSQ